MLLDGLEPGDEERVSALVRLLGARPAACDGGPMPDREGRGAARSVGLLRSGEPVSLVVTGDPTRTGGDGPAGPAGRAAPVVVVGRRGMLRLPEDEAVLADLIVRAGAHVGGGAPMPGTRDDQGEHPVDGARRRLVVGVAGWQGGAGATTVALLLARRASCCAVDAAGAGPGMWGTRAEPPPGVRWGDLRDGETSFDAGLADHLPRLGPIRVLGADARGGAQAQDRRLGPVLTALRAAGNVVVDLGRWDDRSAARAAARDLDVVCLVGRGDADSAIRLAGAVGVHPSGVPVVIVHTARHPSPVLDAVLADLAGDRPGPAPGRCRAPDGRSRRADARRLDHLWERIRRSDGEAWAATWQADP